MKILITTCGVGIGHSSRDVALAKLLEKKGHKIYFASYGTGLHYLQKNNYKPYNLPPMNFHHEDGVLDIEKSVKKSKDIPFTFIKSMYRESRIIKKIKPDLIITDSLYSTPITAKFLNVPCYIITNDLTFGFSQNTNMTSIKYFEKSIRKFIIEISKSTNKILIPDIPESITIPKELEDKTEFIGPLLHKNPQEIDTKENLRRKYGLDNNEKILLVTIGGSDFGKELITNICAVSEEIEVDKIFIFTGLELNPDIFKLPSSNKKVIIKQFTYNLIEWMKLSDLTITLAGHTTSMELISIKKPNIMIPIKNHIEQERNLKKMRQYNITKTIETQQKQQLLELINNTINNLDKIEINPQLYDTFLKYNGRENALKVIENLNNIK